jgi:hypothetical protein
MIGMYLLSLLVFYYCGEDVVLKIFEYSIFFVVLHAIFRNHTVALEGQAPEQQGQQQYAQTPQQQPDFAAHNPPVAF